MDCPYYLISRVTLQVTSALKKGLSSAGVSQVKPAYLGVLMFLWQEDGVKVIDLARRAGLEPSTMTGLLDRMVRDGLLYRAADPNDRRAQRIYLTDDGHDVQKPVSEVVNRIISRVFEGVSIEDLIVTKDVLRKVLENAHKEG